MPALLIAPVATVALLALALALWPLPPERPEAQPALRQLRLLVHAINDDRCVGCEACVEVCPTRVLEMEGSRVAVRRYDDCVQCEKCAQVCPTRALVMHYEDESPPPLMAPDLDDHHQARQVPGLYLIGEAAGRPQVKNAVNLGRLAVEHMTRRGRLRPGSAADVVDVIIVGAGPGGLSAALACVQRGLSYVVLEKDPFIASTIARYPRGKRVMAEPEEVRCLGHLPVATSDKDALVAAWNGLLDPIGLRVERNQVVDTVTREGSLFVVGTDKKRTYRGRRVVLAIGTRGRPNRLGAEGEELPHVRYHLRDPEEHRGRHLLVIGAGDSAVETALCLSAPDLGNRVTLCCRGERFPRVKKRNRDDLARAVAARLITVLTGARVRRFAPGRTEILVRDREVVEQTDLAFVMIGAQAPVAWLERLGVPFVPRPHHQKVPRTDRLIEKLTGRLPTNDRLDRPLWTPPEKRPGLLATIEIPRDELLMRPLPRLRLDASMKSVRVLLREAGRTG